MTGIDIADELWQVLNVPAVTGLLGEGKVWKFNRPINSPYTDVVIGMPDLNTVAINVHTPNLEEYYPIPGETEDNTFPDMAVLRQVVNAIMPLLVSTDDYAIIDKVPGVPVRDDDGSWYATIQIVVEPADNGYSMEATLQEEESSPDGFGGATVNLVNHWTGTAFRQNAANGAQSIFAAGRYEQNLRCDWMVPAAAAPAKYMQLVTEDGSYVIHGIKPENGFFRLFTVRKDGNY